MQRGTTYLILLLAAVYPRGVFPECGKPYYSVHEMMEYPCAGLVVRTLAAEGYVELDCQGQPLNCSSLPSNRIYPNISLVSLQLINCSVSTPLSCVPRAFGATGVDRLTLKHMRGEIRGEDLEGLGVLEMTINSPPRMEGLPAAISTLPALRSLRLLWAPISLSTPPAAPSLTYLEISLGAENPEGGLEVIPAGAFKGMDKLETLSLFGNPLREIDEMAFEGLSSLRSLVLNGNSELVAVGRGAVARAGGLRALHLDRVGLRALDRGLLAGAASLERLSISSRACSSVGPRSFAALPSLSSLAASLSLTASLPRDLFTDSRALVNLTFTHSLFEELPEGLFDGLSNMINLDLSNNRLSSLSAAVFSPLLSIQKIDLSYNKIQTVPEYMFSSLANLTSLSLAHNAISSLSPLSSPLTSLDLSHNRLGWSSPAYDSSDSSGLWSLALSPLSGLRLLQHLDLSHNNISFIFDDWRVNMLLLTRLDLSWNRIEDLNLPDLQFLSAFLTLDLSHNLITALPPPVSEVSPDSLQHFLLGDNPYRCDCNMYPFLKSHRSGEQTYPSGENRFDLNMAICDSPQNLEDLSLADVVLEDLVCGLTDACLLRPAAHRLECRGHNVSSFPDARDYSSDITYMYVQLDEVVSLETLPEYVKTLNMSGLRLTEVGAVPRSVERLDLTNNSLRQVPDHLLDSNTTLYLAHNPIACECSNSDNIIKIQNSKSKILDYNRMSCHDRSSIDSVDGRRLCFVFRASVIGAALAAAGVAAAALLTLAYRFRLELMIFISKYFPSVLAEERLDRDKRYDVFVSFAQEDVEFVQKKLMPVLDAEYTVCVHYRDWVPGLDIPTQIFRSVAESRRTLVVLSAAFVRSAWGAEEFRAAHAQAARDGRARAVTVLLGDVAPRDVPPALRAHLALTTYVKWGDRWFWDKLRYALPRGAAAEARERRRTAGAVARLGGGGGGALRAALDHSGRIVNTALGDKGRGDVY